MSDQTITQQAWTPPRKPGRFSALFYVALAAVTACSFLVGLTQTIP